MTTCPSCGIAGNNFSCPNHTYWGINPNLDLVPPPQTSVNWINSTSAQLFAEIGRLNVLLNDRDKEIERLKGLMPPDERGPGFVGQGSWSVFAEKVVAERDALHEELAERDKEIEKLRGERPAVVAWLNAEAERVDCGHIEALADLIERGEHRREEERCKPVRSIRTPDGKPLLPAAEFSAMRVKDNRERGFSECNFQRQTGRTTAMVIQALEFVKQNSMGGVVIEVDGQRMRKRVKELLLHYADEMGVGHREHARIFTKTPSENISGIDIGLRLRDNVIDDVKNITLVRDPRQDLKVGELVRFEMDGVITERQTGGIVKDFDGNDFEPVQYVITHATSGTKSYTPYNRIIKVIGREKE